MKFSRYGKKKGKKYPFVFRNFNCGQKDFLGDDIVAKNDMEVIMYKILRYLYECMKTGKTPDLADIMWNCKMFDIPKAYRLAICADIKF